MKWHYWIRQGRKLITHLHTTRMHYTCASNISDNPGFVLPQELCLMTAKNFELLYSFQISLHCSAVIKKHFVRVFVCCRSALTHINKAACWTSSCPPGRRLQHGTWSWHNASKYTKINKIENRNDKKKKEHLLQELSVCAVLFRNEYKTELLHLAFILPYTASPSIHAPIFTCTV